MIKIKNILQEKKMVIFMICMGVILLTIIGIYTERAEASEKFNCPKLDLQENRAESEIIVDIKGAVKNPGVYKVEPNTIVDDVIKMAGGLTQEADTSNLNLGKKVTDEMVITVYTKEELINEKKKESIEENTTSNNKISLNNATLEELMTLPGIGESKAKIIIEYRETCGPFQNKEELKNIKGIGESIYAKLENYITI